MKLFAFTSYCAFLSLYTPFFVYNQELIEDASPVSNRGLPFWLLTLGANIQITEHSLGEVTDTH